MAPGEARRASQVVKRVSVWVVSLRQDRGKGLICVEIALRCGEHLGAWRVCSRMLSPSGAGLFQGRDSGGQNRAPLGVFPASAFVDTSDCLYLGVIWSAADRSASYTSPRQTRPAREPSTREWRARVHCQGSEEGRQRVDVAGRRRIAAVAGSWRTAVITAPARGLIRFRGTADELGFGFNSQTQKSVIPWTSR